MSKISVNITTVTFPSDEAKELKEAIEYFGFESLATFFRLAGRVLLDHYKRGDNLMRPMKFESTHSNTHSNANIKVQKRSNAR